MCAYTLHLTVSKPTFILASRFVDQEQQRLQGSEAGSSDNSSWAPASPASEAVLSQRTYFTRVMVAYVAGLACAFAANSITHLGQPALLYIVPSMLGALTVAAATRQELQQLWAFTDKPSFGLGVKPEEEPQK